MQMMEEQMNDEQQIIVTYEQLKERTREKQGGMTLAEYIAKSELQTQ